MSRKLDDLSARFRPFAVEFLARLAEARIPVVIVDTLRTPEEHEKNLARGVSWTKRSKHLDGDAMDVCPFDEYRLNGPDKLTWNETLPVWAKIGAIAESVGLKWGGRFRPPAKPDLGHVEYKEPAVSEEHRA